MKKMMKEIEIEAEEDGVVVVMNAAQELVDITIEPELLTQDNKKRLEKSIKTAFERANKKAQDVAAEKMKPLMGQMGLGGQ